MTALGFGQAKADPCVFPKVVDGEAEKVVVVHLDGIRPVQRLGGGRGCNKFVPVFGGNGTKIAPTRDIFDQPPGQMRWIWDKLADHVGDHVVLSPEGAVLVTSPGTKSSNSRPP